MFFSYIFDTPLSFQFVLLKFVYSEKATKILQNLHLFLSVCTVDKKKGGDFAKFLWPSQNIRTLIGFIGPYSKQSISFINPALLGRLLNQSNGAIHNQAMVQS